MRASLYYKLKKKDNRPDKHLPAMFPSDLLDKLHRAFGDNLYIEKEDLPVVRGMLHADPSQKECYERIIEELEKDNNLSMTIKVEY